MDCVGNCAGTKESLTWCQVTAIPTTWVSPRLYLDLTLYLRRRVVAPQDDARHHHSIDIFCNEIISESVTITVNCSANSLLFDKFVDSFFLPSTVPTNKKMPGSDSDIFSLNLNPIWDMIGVELLVLKVFEHNMDLCVLARKNKLTFYRSVLREMGVTLQDVYVGKWRASDTYRTHRDTCLISLCQPLMIQG